MEQKLKKVLFITNIPAPYRIDFYNELGKHCELTVIFEAKRAPGITFNWKENTISNFKAIFLKEGEIQETKIDWSIFKYIKQLKYDVILSQTTHILQKWLLCYLLNCATFPIIMK